MRVKLIISYLGINFSGYQIQSDKRTVQEELEKVLSDVFKTKISTITSGRTDAGVSALGQVVHFDVDGYSQDINKLYKRLNVLLPEDIRVLKSEEVSDEFHARFNAKKKTYCYNFYVSNAEIPLIDSYAVHIGNKANIESMQKACEYLIGSHDFSAFCASGCLVQSKVREIYYANIKPSPIIANFYTFEICGNGFLYNMVRIIMGTLFLVGLGKITPEEFKQIIDKKDRSLAGRTALSKGLFLKSVEY